MTHHSYLSYLLIDFHSLLSYQEDEEVTVSDVKRRLMLIERNHNTMIPDHYLRLFADSSFQGIEKKSQLFTKGITSLAGEFLEWRRNRVYVKAEKFNQWQRLITYMPPMLLVGASIFKEHSFLEQDFETSFYNQYVAPNLEHTSLISPYIPQLEDMKKEHNGLCDLHLHLNGAMETDSVWLDLLCAPDKICREMQKAIGNNLVKEQYEYFGNWLSPDKFKKLLYKAIALREELHKAIREEISFCESFTRQSESLFYIATLHYLCLYPESEKVAKSFHHYLLILGLANSLLVQQPECFGFEQFQKYTSNNMREISEAKYVQRFFQMSGNQLDYLRKIEGRFSPKEQEIKNNRLIDKIRKGWECFNKEQRTLGIPESKLCLVAHFIKKGDQQKENIRFKKLRLEVRKKAEALISLHNSGSKNGKAIVGIDAAASELDTPPEVFAPAFRELRDNGFQHFTYHAGEDFYHLLGGLRAIYEAITFLDLQRGDRIGHAAATGINPNIWYKNVGDKLVVRKGAYMDDLLFAYYLASTPEGEALQPLMPRLSMRIMELANEVYGSKDNLPAFMSAWKDRAEDIIELDRTGKLDSYPLLKLYHTKDCAERYNVPIEVDIYEILDEVALHKVQLAVLKIMHQREIVIETLPTSNVFIGNHRAFDTYHLANWLKWEEEGNAIPPIVIGTDDAGIFATNIYNEYCHVFTLLVYEYHFSVNKALNIIRRLNYNAGIYIFR